MANQERHAEERSKDENISNVLWTPPHGHTNKN